MSSDTKSSSSLSTVVVNPNFEIMDERTLRELVAPDVSIQTMCIQYPNLDVQCELKYGLIYLLPKIHGLAGEDPHKHLKEFHIVCTTMRPVGVSEEYIKLKVLSFQ